MSCYEWERGEITIPSAEWAGTKKAIRDAWNKEQDRLFEKAKAIYEKIKGKKRPKSWDHPLSKDFDEAPHFLFREKKADEKGYWALRETMRRPTRGDFPHATNRTTTFNDSESELSVHLNNEKRIVIWDVGENNRACDRARESEFGKAVIRVLNNIKYTRGSGGKIIGNDEYNQDSQYEGGGGNYSKDEWGPGIEKNRPMSMRLSGGRW